MDDRQVSQPATEIGNHALLRKLLACTIIFFFIYSPLSVLSGPSRQSTDILILKSGTATFYDNVVSQIKTHVDHLCNDQGTFCDNFSIQSYISNEAKPLYQKYDLIVTLGSKARSYAERHLKHFDTINAMIPNQTVRKPILTSSHRQNQIIVLEQPVERSLKLIKKVIPHARRIGLLTHTKKDRDITDLAEKAHLHGFSIHTEHIDHEEEIGRKLSLLLDKVDVLLAQPNIKIYNRKTVSKILLSSYRRKIPVIGYSSAYVKAGALAAVFSSPKDIGKDIGESIGYFLKHRNISSSSIYPRFFSVSVNRKVGSSLGIKINTKPDDIVKYIHDNER